MTQESLLANADDKPVIDPNKNYLEELVGEGKKYKTAEDLAKSRIHADVHIQTLESRMDAMREDYERVLEQSKAVPRLQELLEKLEGNQQVVTQPQNTNADTMNTVLDPNQVESLISSKLEQFEQTKKQTENFNMVQSKVKETLGDNFKAILKQRAESLGLGDADVTAMAKANPNLFFKTFDIGTNARGDNFQAPPQSNVRSNAFSPTGEKKRTMSYYQELRKTNPKLFYDKNIAVQMDKDALALGEAFFDV